MGPSQEQGAFRLRLPWDVWRKPDDKKVESFTIITTEPNELVQPVHNRMPVILRTEVVACVTLFRSQRRIESICQSTQRKEHGAKSEAKGFVFFAIACCLVPIAYFHRITLSALTSTFGGIVRPICFAALRLMMNSNFFGCSIGRSAGFAPFKILST